MFTINTPLGVTEAGLLGSSAAIRAVREELEWAIRSNASILITGEQGVRKRAIAEFIHGQSARASGPFVSLDCSTESSDVLESRLTDYMHSSPPGTLVLHRVANICLELQDKLAGFLENGDVRIVTTDRTLYEETLAGRFRDALFYRLNTIHIDLPPLRNRKEDVGMLVSEFGEKFRAVHHAPRLRFSDHVLRTLTDYSWPGNISQLENTVKDIVVRTQSDTIVVTDLPTEILRSTAS